jgi:hypothetical protein
MAVGSLWGSLFGGHALYHLGQLLLAAGIASGMFYRTQEFL